MLRDTTCILSLDQVMTSWIFNVNVDQQYSAGHPEHQYAAKSILKCSRYCDILRFSTPRKKSQLLQLNTGQHASTLHRD